MTESYYVGCYWLGRHESAEACARRAEFFFRLLDHCEPTWTRWQDTETDNSRVHPDAATFARMFETAEHQQGSDGFRFSLWVGDTVAEATTVNVRCGSATPWLSSMCVLGLPTRGAVAERASNPSVLTQVLRAMILAWDPEWGLVTSHAHRQRTSDRAKAGTFLGQSTYFSRSRGAVPPLPAPVRVEPVEDKGTLVLLTPGPFTATNPEHTALEARVQRLLHEAGLLRPLGPR